MAKAGPRRKTKAAKLSKVVSVLFTQDEFKQIRAMAGEQSVSSYIRERVLSNPLEDAPPSELQELRSQVEAVLARLDQVEKGRGSKKRR